MTTVTSHITAATAIIRPSAALAFLLAALLTSSHAIAYPPGTSSVVSFTLPSSGEQVQGWSVEHGLLGRPVYASAGGKQIGTVLDLIVTSGELPYVLVIGVGGFIELHGHPVAVPLDDVLDQGGLLILPGATRASLKAMQPFSYANVTTQRIQFVKAASVQLEKANAQLVFLKRRATAETGATKTQFEKDNAELQADITDAEDKLANLKKAESAHWVLVQKEVQDAISKVHASMAQEKAEPVAPAPREP